MTDRQPARDGGLAGSMIPRTTTRLQDERFAPRYDGIVRDAVLSARGREQLVRVINISAEGAMIVPAPPLHIGEAIGLRLPGELRVEAHVRWIRGTRMGVNLTTPLLIGVPQGSISPDKNHLLKNPSSRVEAKP